MAAYRFPIFVFQDCAGAVTARVVDLVNDAVAVAATTASARDQLKEFLTWIYKRNDERPGPELTDAKLLYIRATVQPEYRVSDRVYPCSEVVSMRLPCVCGRRETGLLACVMPTLNISFDYYDATRFKSLATHYAQTELRGKNPQQLSRYLCPEQAYLEELIVQIPRKVYTAFHRPRNKEATLNSIAEPLAGKIRGKVARAWEREGQVGELVQRLGKEKANVVLVGEPGVGKTALLVDAARELERMMTRDEGAASSLHRFWLTNAGRMIAGMKYLGQWQERCEALISELSAIEGYLCAESCLDLVRIGGQGPTDSVASFLRPFLTRGELHMVVEATPTELDACRRLLPGFVDAFQVLHVPELDRERSIRVLDRICTALAHSGGLSIEEGTTHLIYRLFRRFLPYRVFPGAPADFLERLFDECRRNKSSRIDPAVVIQHFVRLTGLPELFLRDDIPLRKRDVVTDFEKQVIGQPSACHAAASLVTKFKAGLNDPHRPIGVFLFCGPTGVGKTELAKTMSRFFFGHGIKDDRLLRLDMSEYAHPGAAERLLCNADGEPSELIKRIRQQPFTVVLLDELEKAAPEVFDVLLNLLDEGRLADRFGRQAVFRSAIIVMTSNLGASPTSPLGFITGTTVDYESEAALFFRPEFYNRIDALVTFDSLNIETIRAIVRKELSEIAEREGFKASGLKLAWTEQLVQHLADKGFDRRYGARPLQRALEETIVDPLARLIAQQPTLCKQTIHLDIDQTGAVLIH